jgi:PGF-pre-PGF domain-containing protein
MRRINLSQILILFFVLACLSLISLPCGAFDVSPLHPDVGDVLTISGTTTPDSSVSAKVSFVNEVPVSSGSYYYRINDVRIPSGPNSFHVKAEGVKDLEIKVKSIYTLGMWVSAGSKSTSNGVASISASGVPAGTYSILILGDAVDSNDVKVTVTASSTIDADKNGFYRYTYSTSSIPRGEFTLTVDGETRVIGLGTYVPQSGGSSSGGGSSGQSPDAVEDNVVLVKGFSPNVVRGLPLNLEISDPECPVRSLNLTFNLNINDIPISIEVLDHMSVMSLSSPKGVVYSYFNVWIGYAGFSSEDSLLNSSLVFNVNSSWINDTHVDPESIVLLHYDVNGDVWEEVDTHMRGFGPDGYVFVSRPKSYSPFSIVGEINSSYSASLNGTDTDGMGNSVPTNETTGIQDQEDGMFSDNLDGSITSFQKGLIFVIFIILITGGIALIIKKSK